MADLPTGVESTDLDLSGMSALPKMGVVPSAVQASDNSIQFPVLPPVSKTISQTSLCGPSPLIQPCTSNNRL